MNTAIQFGDTISDYSRESSPFLYEIAPMKNEPDSYDLKPIYGPSKVSDRDVVNLKLNSPKSMAGPDPSEEEQRDRTTKEKINTEEDQHKEKPDHSEEDIYDTDSEQKEKDKKNSHN
ncbi:hypothetical protein HS960_07425 [Sphingobacterium paramultivorum]|uniref:Uncharacterized protein n=1 Tax=Sphingobacterium paramultivorum TaxID=2886510 RepID=A0A7G5E0H0_9SPHI|nr:hypothetical protein [Sphingobacterium paramultivorum]QMV67495.1 hypothetical protein HS960_07425 [Sphingobacterium paramultivorum]WSO16365.1 hypothetical protein VUL84_07400 [Sphingobacterium paramultivorum]